jgi:hypothetical protein
VRLPSQHCGLGPVVLSSDDSECEPVSKPDINTEAWSSSLGVGRWTKIQLRKKVTVTKPQRGGQGPIWAVEPYDE